jgi:hypothetical protein
MDDRRRRSSVGLSRVIWGIFDTRGEEELGSWVTAGINIRITGL